MFNSFPPVFRLRIISHRGSTSMLHLAIRLGGAHAPAFWFILILYNQLVWVVTRDLYATLNRFLFVVLYQLLILLIVVLHRLSLSLSILGFCFCGGPCLLACRYKQRSLWGDKTSPVCLVAHHSCLFRNCIFLFGFCCFPLVFQCFFSHSLTQFFFFFLWTIPSSAPSFPIWSSAFKFVQSNLAAPHSE